jgi:lysozyme
MIRTFFQTLLASVTLATSPAAAPAITTPTPIEVVQQITAPIPESTCFQNCTTTVVGLALIRGFEGYSPFIYKDAVGLPTIGFGHLISPGEKFQEPLMTAEAEDLFRKDVRRHEIPTNKIIRVPLYPHQFDALLSFAYNEGVGKLSGSTLLKLVNAKLYDDVSPELRKWIYAGHPPKKLRGLIVRRDAEVTLWKRREPAPSP